MAGINEDDIQKVREASDLVAVVGERTPVKQRGRDFWCCCPLHNEKTPSFKIDPVLQLWHCFGCGEGDVYKRQASIRPHHRSFRTRAAYAHDP